MMIETERSMTQRSGVANLPIDTRGPTPRLYILLLQRGDAKHSVIRSTWVLSHSHVVQLIGAMTTTGPNGSGKKEDNATFPSLTSA